MDTCTATTFSYHSIAYYTHLVPLALSVLIIALTLLKSNTHAARAFAWFAFLFSLWLAGDLLLWVVPNYTLVYTVWSVLDFINVLFCAAAIYFFHTLGGNARYTKHIVVVLCAVVIPPFVINLMGLSVHELQYVYCEVAENIPLTYYKLAVEIGTVLWIAISTIITYLKKDALRIRRIVIATALISFIAVFGITDHISSLTGVYEIGLYGLFVLPISLMLIVFAIIQMDFFNLRSYGVQVGVYSFVIFIASQFLFLTDNVGRVLNGVTFVLALFIAQILIRHVRQEQLQRKQIEDLNTQLMSANTALADLNQQKNEFLSLATHQLRSPLTSIKWGLEAVGDENVANLTDLQKKTFYHVQTTTNDLIRVVGDLLDVSKAEQGKLVLNKTNVDIEKLVQKVVDEFTIVASHKGLALTSDMRIVTHPLLYSADETKLQQAITNLIDNAIKYTPEGSVKVTVTEDAGHIFIAVSDTGAGIPAEEISTLFTKFMRGSAGKHASGGSGLGLYLVKQVVEMHGGSITVTSGGLESGSTFTITLVKE